MNLSHHYYCLPEIKVFLLKRYSIFFFNLTEFEQNFSFQILWKENVFGKIYICKELASYRYFKCSMYLFKALKA